MGSRRLPTGSRSESPIGAWKPLRMTHITSTAQTLHHSVDKGHIIEEITSDSSDQLEQLRDKAVYFATATAVLDASDCVSVRLTLWLGGRR